eukprot:5011191-Prymnesium_polylepis.1
MCIRDRRAAARRPAMQPSASTHCASFDTVQRVRAKMCNTDGLGSSPCALDARTNDSKLWTHARRPTRHTRLPNWDHACGRFRRIRGREPTGDG